MNRRNAIAAIVLAATALGGGVAALALLRTAPRHAGSAATPLPAAQAFLARFMSEDGRIVDTGNDGVSHSEGQGYGLLIAEAADDRVAFDRLLTWTGANLAVRDDALHAWRWSPKTGSADDLNNATDGDMLIAWALLRAHDRWGSTAYRDHAASILDAIADTLVRPTPYGPVLLPGAQGFEHGGALTLNLSYWVFPAIERFEQERPGQWRAIRGAGLALLRDAGAGQYGLVTDWTSMASAGELAPASGWPPEFGYNAVRAPLHLAWTQFESGAEVERQDLLARYRAFWRVHPPSFSDRWDVMRDKPAGGPAPAGFSAVATLADSGCDAPHDDAALPTSESYYSAVLIVLVALARENACTS